MATATRKSLVNSSLRRPLTQERPASLKSPMTKPRQRPQDVEMSAPLHQDRRYHEAPEVPEETLEHSEATLKQESEAPDAGEGRCSATYEYFTHGRSWS
jgi:hypothetical protein